jgi:hypothetical protein
VQARLEHVGLYAHFTFGRDDPTGRHLRAEVASLFDRDLARADVDEELAQDDEQDDERDAAQHQQQN